MVNHNQTMVHGVATRSDLKVKTSLQAGGRYINHNESLVRDVAKKCGLNVKTHFKAGGRLINHNETLISAEHQKAKSY